MRYTSNDKKYATTAIKEGRASKSWAKAGVALVLSLVLALGLCPAVPSIAFAAEITPDTSWYVGHEGDGEYKLSTIEQLEGLAELVNADNDEYFSGKTIILENPNSQLKVINGGGGYFTPIGTEENPFNGTFDGAGFTISNLNIDADAVYSDASNGISYYGYAGLFGHTGSDSQITDLTLDDSVSLEINIAEYEGSKDADDGDTGGTDDGDDGDDGDKDNTKDTANPIDSTYYMKYIGLVVGYCEGSLENVSCAGDLVLTSTTMQINKDPYTISGVGGIAGVCYRDIMNCNYSGKLYVEQGSVPVSNIDEAILARFIGGVVGFAGDYTQYGETSTAGSHGTITNCTNTARIAEDEVINNNNDDTKNNNDKKIESTGGMIICTPSEAGTDRFGSMVSAQSSQVGGIVGYSRGSIVNCTNSTYLNVENATLTGGIVGSLRSVESTENSNSVGNGKDEGTDASNDPIECANSINDGIVIARAAVGGIVGQAGTNTTITGCINGTSPCASSKDDRIDAAIVIGTRWNKPFIGGIVGRTYGDVCYCGNLGLVASGSDFDYEERTFKQGIGYYSAGIAGGSFYYTSSDISTGTSVRTTPIPLIYNCYNVGVVDTLDGYRSRSIVGNNAGNAYDNVALEGSCPDDMCVYGDVPEIETDAEGYGWNNLVCTAGTITVDGIDQTQKAADSLKGNGPMTYKERVAKENESGKLEQVWDYGTKDSVFQQLNTQVDATNGWETYWMSAPDTINGGYPMLNWQYPGGDKDSLDGVVLELISNAEFTGGEAIPNVSATLDGVTLLQNVDFRVMPQTDATAVTPGSTPYVATIEGIGKYGGEPSATVNYGIDPCNLANCSASIDSKTFNWDTQNPDPSKLTVTTTAGVTFSNENSDFILALNGLARDAGNYTVTVTPNAGSENFTGSLETTWHILQADLKSDIEWEGDGDIEDYPYITYPALYDSDLTQRECRWSWYSTVNNITEMDESKVPTVLYTGHDIEPGVENVTYLGRKLDPSEGDFAVDYGSLNHDSDTPTSDPDDQDGDGGENSDPNDNYPMNDGNKGAEGKNYYGAILVRYVPGGNFRNFENMVFHIDGVHVVGDNAKKNDLTWGGRIEVPEVIYDGEPVYPPVTVTYGGNQVLTEGVDYKIVSFENNEGLGTGRVTVEGIGLFEGTLTTTFEIIDGVVFEFSYTVDAASGTATITGVTYNGVNDTFDLVIPSTVTDENGKTYTVTAIGDKAFGGEKSTDFDGTDKLKINSVTIPATVTSIGAYAFGSKVQQTTPSITEVIFEEGSQLTTIGEGAFSYCKNLTEFTFPAGVKTIGSLAFYQCSGLVTLIFDTKDSNLPSSIASDSFSGVGGTRVEVEVLGYGSATRVKQLVTDNEIASSGSAGKNGGRNFHFVERKGDLSNAVITAIPDQIYTGSAIEPAVEVVLDGAVVDPSDYTLSFTDNVSLGSVATVVATGANGYTGSCSATFNIVAETGYFTDVQDPEEYYYDAVYDLAALGVITGYNPTTFGVGDSMSRAQLVTIMWRYCEPGEYATYDEPNAKNTTGLPDVEDGMYYTGAVNWAVTTGVVTGNLHDDGTYTFNPDDPISFDQLATIVARYVLGDFNTAANYPTTALDNGAFTDKSSVEEFARGPMSWAIEVGLVTGNNNHDGTYTLDALSPVARERAATVLWRSIDGGLLKVS